MQNAIQLSQLLGDGSVLTGKKTAGKAGVASIEDVLLGNTDQFKTLLLGGLAKSRQARVLAGDALVTATAKKAPALDPAALLTQTQLSPELLLALKNLTPDDLKSLPPELAVVFAPHMTVEGKLDQNVQDLLDTLSSVVSDGNAKLGDLFKVINDPKLAAFLAGFASALHTLQNPALATAVSADDDTPAPASGASKSFSNLLFTAPTVTAATITPTGDGVTLVTDKGTITINVADMNADQFKAFKKLAFADIAPFLMQPRTVRIDAHTVMKIAQGPSFLDDSSPLTTFIHDTTGLAPVLPAAAVNTPAPEIVTQPLTPQEIKTLAQGQSSAVSVNTPIFLDADIVQSATAALTPQVETATSALPAAPVVAVQTTAATSVAPSTVPQHHAFNRANFFAALLGVTTQNSAPVQNSATASSNIQQNNINTLAAALTGSAPQQVAPAATPVTLGQQMAAMVAQTPGLRSAGPSVLKGLDTSFAKMDDLADLASIDTALPLRADTVSPGSAASILLTAKSAVAQHPASYLVSVALQRNAEGMMTGADRQFTIQLEPANLGRVKITLEFGENNSIKAKLLAERPETVALLQKDAGTLERTLQNSGFDVKADSLTFDLGQNGSFEGAMSQNGNSQQNPGKQGSDDDGTEFATIQSVMPIFIDPVTGLTHVNIVI